MIKSQIEYSCFYSGTLSKIISSVLGESEADYVVRNSMFRVCERRTGPEFAQVTIEGQKRPCVLRISGRGNQGSKVTTDTRLADVC